MQATPAPTIAPPVGAPQPSGLTAATPQPDRGDDHRREKGQRGLTDAVGDRHAGFIGQHRDEMRRPDAASDHDAGGHDPGRPYASEGGAGAMEKTDGGQGRDEADDAGNNDEPPVMLGCQAIQNPKHDGPGRRGTLHVSRIWIALGLIEACLEGEFPKNA